MKCRNEMKIQMREYIMICSEEGKSKRKVKQECVWVGGKDEGVGG